MPETERGPLIVGPDEGRKADLGGLGVDFKIWGASTSGGLSIVEHPMEPGRLVPPHVHRNEDELSYVVTGTFGIRIGDAIATAGPGSYVFKPRNVPHTFWNPGPGPARLIELIWPAGFERFFGQLDEIAHAATGPEDFAARRDELGRRYGLEFLPEWIPELKARYNLKVLGEP
ncbi:MAG TPA: cupin domain-containing protein [bacterium]|nr:cupin domain-containing protein [bacterium]